MVIPVHLAYFLLSKMWKNRDHWNGHNCSVGIPKPQAVLRQTHQILLHVSSPELFLSSSLLRSSRNLHGSSKSPNRLSVILSPQMWLGLFVNPPLVKKGDDWLAKPWLFPVPVGPQKSNLIRCLMQCWRTYPASHEAQKCDDFCCWWWAKTNGDLIRTYKNTF